MSVFVAGNVSDVTPRPRPRKKYETRYSAKYEEEYEWVGVSSKGQLYALCKWCSVDICIKSVGAKGLRNHEITARHKQKASDRPAPLPPPQPTHITNAVYPVLEVEGVVEHQGVDVPSSPRPVTPQTPNTPLSPQGEHPQPPLPPPPPPPPPLLDFSTQLPAPQTTSSTPSPTQCFVITQTKGVEESLIIEYDNPETSSVPAKPQSTTTPTATSVPSAPVKKEKESDEKPSTNHCAASNSGPLDDKLGFSTDDLTCNVCGQEYTQWTHLKKHLLDHILHAQNSAAENKPKISQVRGRTGAGRSSSRAAQTEQMVTSQPKQEPEDSKAVSRGIRQRGPSSRKVRGRGRGASKKNTNTQSQTHVHITQEATGDNKQYNDTQTHTSVVPAPDVKDYMDEDSEEVDECAEETGETAAAGSERKPNEAKRKPGPLQCRVCRVVFFSKVELQEHQQSEHNNGRPYECNHCHKYFTTQNHMEVHIRHKHILGPNPCQCTICGKVLSSRTNLRIHMRIHKGERPFECSVCRKTFSRKANMEMHLVYHSGERRFTCEICGQSFFAINALKRHNKLHTGERNYACEICGATYVTGTDLRRHGLKHSQVKPYPCHLCEKQFTRSHDLKVHVRYHNKELRYTCTVCNKQFVESGNFKRHMRRHTGERPYSCIVCMMTFSQVHHLKTHMRTNHPEEIGGEEERQGYGIGRGRVPSIHRNPRLAMKRTNKPAHMPKLLAALTPHTQQQHPHLPSQGGSQGLHSDQPVSPTSLTTTTTTGPSPQSIPGGVNHSGFIHSYNPHIYNHSVMPHYPSIYDVCQPQNTPNHISMH